MLLRLARGEAIDKPTLEALDPDLKDAALLILQAKPEEREQALVGWLAIIDGRDAERAKAIRQELAAAEADLDLTDEEVAATGGDGPGTPGSGMGPNGAVPPQQWQAVRRGTYLRCRDRPNQDENIGKTLRDCGDSCLMRFREGEEHQTEVRIAKAEMTWMNGRPLTEPESGVVVGEDGWPALRIGELPPSKEFPVDVLPAILADFAAAVAKAVGCNVSLVVLAMLAVAAGVIGRTVRLRLNSRRYESASLYVANVARPGDGKSPALGYVVAPLDAIEKALRAEFQAAKQAHKERLADLPKGDPRPDPPVPRRLMLDDTTVEAMFRTLSRNERGLLVCQDELASLILGANQYRSGGKGNDVAHFCKLWTGARTTIDRVSNENQEPVVIPHPCVSIVGNLTPSSLPALAGTRGSDGFLDRWLFTYPDRLPRPRAAERGQVGEEDAGDWEAVVQRLWQRPLRDYGGHDGPYVVGFTDPGRAEFDRLYDNLIDEVNDPAFADELRGPWMKMETYASRLALVLALVRHAADPTDDWERLPAIDPLIARDAWGLVDFLKNQHLRVRAALEGKGLGAAPEGARLILRWLRNHRPGEFNEGDLTRDMQPLRKDRAILEDGLKWLTDKHAIRHAPPAERPEGTRGRRPSPRWLVHPDLGSEKSELSGNGPDGDDADLAAVYSPISPISPSDIREEVAR